MPAPKHPNIHLALFGLDLALGTASAGAGWNRAGVEESLSKEHAQQFLDAVMTAIEQARELLKLLCLAGRLDLDHAFVKACNEELLAKVQVQDRYEAEEWFKVLELAEQDVAKLESLDLFVDIDKMYDAFAEAVEFADYHALKMEAYDAVYARFVETLGEDSGLTRLMKQYNLFADIVALKTWRAFSGEGGSLRELHQSYGLGTLSDRLGDKISEAIQKQRRGAVYAMEGKSWDDEVAYLERTMSMLTERDSQVTPGSNLLQAAGADLDALRKALDEALAGNKTVVERAKREAEEKRKKEEEEARLKAEEEERKRKEEEERKKREEEEARLKAEEEERLRKEEEERKAREEEERKKREEQERIKAEEEAKRKAEEEERKRKEEEERRQQRVKEEAEQKRKAEELARLKEEEDAKAKEEAEAQAKIEAEEQAKRKAEEATRTEKLVESRDDSGAAAPAASSAPMGASAPAAPAASKPAGSPPASEASPAAAAKGPDFDKVMGDMEAAGELEDPEDLGFDRSGSEGALPGVRPANESTEIKAVEDPTVKEFQNELEQMNALLSGLGTDDAEKPDEAAKADDTIDSADDSAEPEVEEDLDAVLARTFGSFGSSTSEAKSEAKKDGAAAEDEEQFEALDPNEAERMFDEELKRHKTSVRTRDELQPAPSTKKPATKPPGKPAARQGSKPAMKPTAAKPGSKPALKPTAEKPSSKQGMKPVSKSALDSVRLPTATDLAIGRQEPTAEEKKLLAKEKAMAERIAAEAVGMTADDILASLEADTKTKKIRVAAEHRIRSAQSSARTASSPEAKPVSDARLELAKKKAEVAKKKDEDSAESAPAEGDDFDSF